MESTLIRSELARTRVCMPPYAFECLLLGASCGSTLEIKLCSKLACSTHECSHGYTHICICVCTYVCICIYIYTHTHIHTYILPTAMLTCTSAQPHAPHLHTHGLVTSGKQHGVLYKYHEWLRDPCNVAFLVESRQNTHFDLSRYASVGVALLQTKSIRLHADQTYMLPWKRLIDSSWRHTVVRAISAVIDRAQKSCANDSTKAITMHNTTSAYTSQ
jgi:hypothetical protein